MTDATGTTLVKNPFGAPQLGLDRRIIKSHVDRLFREAPDRFEKRRQNPVTGGFWLAGDDPIAPQKRMAVLALFAREWFAFYGPHDGQPLPLSDEEIANRKYKWDSKYPLLSYIISCFAHSLRSHKYDVNSHPSFDDFARGVVAAGYAPGFIREDEVICKRYPPRPLQGLNRGNCWDPPK
jgi:hypothetical protein